MTLIAIQPNSKKSLYESTYRRTLNQTLEKVAGGALVALSHDYFVIRTRSLMVFHATSGNEIKLSGLKTFDESYIDLEIINNSILYIGRIYKYFFQLQKNDELPLTTTETVYSNDEYIALEDMSATLPGIIPGRILKSSDLSVVGSYVRQYVACPTTRLVGSILYTVNKTTLQIFDTLTNTSRIKVGSFDNIHPLLSFFSSPNSQITFGVLSDKEICALVQRGPYVSFLENKKLFFYEVSSKKIITTPYESVPLHFCPYKGFIAMIFDTKIIIFDPQLEKEIRTYIPPESTSFVLSSASSLALLASESKKTYLLDFSINTKEEP